MNPPIAGHHPAFKTLSLILTIERSAQTAVSNGYCLRPSTQLQLGTRRVHCCQSKCMKVSWQCNVLPKKSTFNSRLKTNPFLISKKIKAYNTYIYHKPHTLLQLERRFCVTDRAGVKPISLCPDFDLRPSSHMQPWSTHLPTPEGWKDEMAWLVDNLLTKWSHINHVRRLYYLAQRVKTGLGTAYPHSFWLSCTFVWFAALEIWVGLSLFKIYC